MRTCSILLRRGLGWLPLGVLALLCFTLPAEPARAGASAIELVADRAESDYMAVRRRRVCRVDRYGYRRCYAHRPRRRGVRYVIRRPVYYYYPAPVYRPAVTYRPAYSAPSFTYRPAQTFGATTGTSQRFYRPAPQTFGAQTGTSQRFYRR